MKIEEMKVSEQLVRAMKDIGYTDYTPIQERAIPVGIEGKDIIGQSQTGTGKTAAFAIPILEKINAEIKKPQAFVICPTRELAVQVAAAIRGLAKYLHDVKTVAVFGGEPIHHQIKQLKAGAQIIVGTPGRLIDHMTKRRTIRTGHIHTVVLDEADEMLKMGFREDIEQILDMIHNERQTILFSATMPKSIIEITNRYQKEPVLIEVDSKATAADTVMQEYCVTRRSDKEESLYRIISMYKPKRCLVFCNRKRTVDEIAESLTNRGIRAEKIHGDLKQEHRLSVLGSFNKAIIPVLVATDVAARGLDIKEVDLVINYDMPEKSDFYIHRIGRSGRAGMSGHAITLVASRETRSFRVLLQEIQTEMKKISIPSVKQIKKSNEKEFIQKITDDIKSQDLSSYENIVSKLAEGNRLEDVCAILIKEKLKYDEFKNENDLNFTDRNKKSGNIKRSNSNRFFVNIGKKDKMKEKHIKEVVVSNAKIKKGHIHSVDVFDKFSFVELDKEVEDKVLKRMNGLRIDNRRIVFEKAKSKSKK